MNKQDSAPVVAKRERQEHGTVAVGKAIFPARRYDDGTVTRNRKADGSGAWIKVAKVEGFVPDAQPEPEQEDLGHATGRAQRPVVQVEGRFYKVRGNGTKRHVPTLAGDDLALAETVRGKREAGSTMRQLADEMHLSVSTLRRLLNSLALTEAQSTVHAQAK